jgi:ATP-dependent DNA helicase RecG
MTIGEKDQVMRAFSSRQIMALIATTVVEVGVHVPDATIMVVHHPERFGLSQLHQLRGRVGRGGIPGFCFLSVTDDTSYVARQRLNVLTRVSDGFQIAAEDLKLRGPGEFFGLRQHGVPGLKIANPAVDQKIVEIAQSYVKRLVETDVGLQSPEAEPCRRYLAAKEFDALGRTIS